MIDWVETPHGLMPRAYVAKLAKQKADHKAALAEGITEIGDQRAHLRGVSSKEMKALRKAPDSTLRRAAKRAREGFSKLTLEKAYPCRTCSVVKDAKYREACDLMNRLPCFVNASMRGCRFWKPQAAFAPVAASIQGGLLLPFAAKAEARATPGATTKEIA